MTTSDRPDPDIYEQIAHAARAMHGSLLGGVMTPQEVLDDATEAAVKLLEGVGHAGVTLVRRHSSRREPEFLESTAETSTVASTFDELQHRYGQGPCFDAIWAHQTVRIDDAKSETRWPQLMRAVREQTPIRSTLSIQLYIDGEELGALNLHSEKEHGVGGDVEEQAFNLATHAAIALSSARRGQQFHSALASRDLIGQAKGMIMERFNIDALAAFNLLRTLSQETNVPVIELATRLTRRANIAADG